MTAITITIIISITILIIVLLDLYRKKHEKEWGVVITIGEDSIHCDECAFFEDCEDRFTQCVANYQHEGKPVHLKSCEYLQWNTMSEESKAFFLQECLPHEYKREQ